MIALVVTWAMLVKSEPGVHVGPLYLNETFAQVEQALGPAPVTKTVCGTEQDFCLPTLTYTDGADSLVITAHYAGPHTSKVDVASQTVEHLVFTRGASAGAARITKPNLGLLRDWKWEAIGVFAPPPQTLPGWQREVNDAGVWLKKHVCDFTSTASSAYPPGAVVLTGWKKKAGQGQWGFDLGYLDFAEPCR